MKKRIKAGRIVFSGFIIIAFVNTVVLSWYNPLALPAWIDAICKLMPLAFELGAGIIGTSWIRSVVPKPISVGKVEGDECTN
jgi:hypothetical protein